MVVGPGFPPVRFLPIESRDTHDCALPAIDEQDCLAPATSVHVESVIREAMHADPVDDEDPYLVLVGPLRRESELARSGLIGRDLES